MTISRLFLPLYLLACPENFIYILWQYFSPGVEINIYRHTLNSLYGNHYLVANPEESSFSSTSNPIYSAGVFLVVWLGLQVIIMFAQAKLGSRFFVPKQFLPYRYDYHRPLPAQFRPVYSPASNSSTANGNAGVSGRFNGAESPNFITRTASWFGLTLRRSGSNSQNQHENTFGDIETGALLTQTQVDHGEEAVQQGPECVICYNAIHLNVSRDYMVSVLIPFDEIKTVF